MQMVSSMFREQRDMVSKRALSWKIKINFNREYQIIVCILLYF